MVAQNFNIKAADEFISEPIPDFKGGTFKPRPLNIIFEKRNNL